MRTEIEKYCLRVNTVNELVKMRLAYYGVLTYYFSLLQMHCKNQETHG